MPKITVMPMLGRVRNERASSLQGCHALFESASVRTFEPSNMPVALSEAVRATLLSDYAREQLQRYPEDGVYLIVKFQP